MQGRMCLGEGFRAVMGEMLTQGANYSRVPARRLVWLQAMMPLLKVPQAFCIIDLGHAGSCPADSPLPALYVWGISLVS